MTMISQRRRTIALAWLIMVALTTINLQRIMGVNADVYDDYVKEVLEEDEGGQSENEYYHDDAYYERQKAQQQDAEQRKRAEEDRIAQEKADRLAAERERVFQAELDRMNTEQQKAALRQKKRDAKVVKSVLKAAHLEDLYQILGIRNWNIKIPSRTIRIPIIGRSFTIPGITIKETTMKDIRRAYRNRAMAVHPDKNRDGRAQEAFILVEESASTLSDNLLRQQYDEKVQASRRLKRDSQIQLLSGVLNTTKGTILSFLKAARVLLGPFATPVIILGLLMA